jgi:hypothetical protein
MSDTEHIQKIAADTMRANATKVFTTKCAACGKNHTQTLRWLQKKRFVCPSCGGRLDDHPLHQLTLLAMRKLGRGTKNPSKSAERPVESAPDQKFDAAKGYQLVLQFHGDSLHDLDAVVALEDELIEQLGDSADVDGHDIGSGETNIFIFTSAPKRTFQKVRQVLERRQSLKAIIAAFRPIDGEHYTVIWPEGLRKEFVIA